MKTYSWDNNLNSDGSSSSSSSSIGLVITDIEHKTLNDINRVIKLNKQQAVIDKFIELHIPTTDSSQAVVENWYEQHTLVLTLDKNVKHKDIVDTDGVVVGQEPTAYDIALANRTELEEDNTWLKGLRGITSPARPLFSMTVEQFKLANPSIFKAYNKALGVLINGINISLSESNQHGLADIAVMIDKTAALGQSMFPISISMETMAGVKVILIQDQAEFDILFTTFGLARQEFFK